MDDGSSRASSQGSRGDEPVPVPLARNSQTGIEDRANELETG